MTTGTTLMLLLSAGNWDIHTLEVGFALYASLTQCTLDKKCTRKTTLYESIACSTDKCTSLFRQFNIDVCFQLDRHYLMPTLAKELDR